jgi:trehalose 6-phosphate synthase/phosphatase
VTLRARWVTLRARWVTLRASLGDAESSLGDFPQAHMADLRKRFAGRKVMLGVDRLDMIKGIPQKLLAYEMFLDENPEWCDKVLLVQIAVPSRSHVPEYQRLASLVHEMVGRINGRFGTLGSMPIHHLDRSLTFYELCALYALTDVALVTPVRDGMNLVLPMQR